MRKYIFLFLFWSLHTLAEENLGQELQPRKTPEGNFQFAVNYSYSLDGQSANGRWNAFFVLNTVTAPAQVKWNIYSLKTRSYLTDWNSQPVQNGRDVLILGNLSIKGPLATRFIQNQGNALLVFADPTGKALYFLDVGKICQESPSSFMNLTEASVRCDRINIPLQ